MRSRPSTCVRPGSVRRACVRRLLQCGLIAVLLPTKLLVGQSGTAAEPVTTLHMGTQIVSLDVTVVDKKGHPITPRLGREDFTITEDGKPQQLLYFEPPSTHLQTATTVFVLDELNTNFADAAYFRSSLRKYFKGLPETLPAPAELMVLHTRSFQIVQPFTRNRAELLSALIHLPASEMDSRNIGPDELLLKTFSALEGVALENLGDAGRRNVVWLGRGYGVSTTSQSTMMRARTERFIRYMTNTLVEGRMTLYVIFPPSEAAGPAPPTASQLEQARDISVADPYDGIVSFRTIAAETGGFVYFGTNDLKTAMAKALDVGTSYYTLSYRPEDTITDSRFRRIRVTLGNPNLRIITKSGYYAPEPEQEDAPQTNQIFQMTEAGKSTLPFHDLDLHVTHIDRSLDGKTAEFTVFAEGKNLPWRREGEGGSLAEMTVGGLSLSRRGEMLASHFRNVNMMTRSQDPVALQQTTASFKLILHTPSSTDHVRLIVRSLNNGHMGTVDVFGAAIHAAPQTARALVPGSPETMIKTPVLPDLSPQPIGGEQVPE